MLKYIDLFCGIGGFRLALDKNKLQCVFSCEIDKNAREVYFNNFHEKPHGDIYEIHEKQVPAHDILCAGFPCQAFSISGYKLGFNDPRGILYKEIIRIAKYHKPSILLLENVPALAYISNKTYFNTIVQTLKEIGYIVHYNILNSSYYGIPQARKRLYFVCFHRQSKYMLKYTKPIGCYTPICLNDIAEKNVDESFFLKRKNITIKYPEHLVRSKGLFGYEKKLHPIYIGFYGKRLYQSSVIYSSWGHAGTITTDYGYNYSFQGRIRRLTLKEQRILMGFPDNFKLNYDNKTQTNKQLGNSVIPKIIDKIYNSIAFL